MSKLCWEDAWLLLAVKYAHDNNEFATKEKIIQAGDYINHAIFIDSELEHGINTLCHEGLLEVNEGIYKLLPSFHSLWEKSGAKKHSSAQKQLEILCIAMGIT